MSDQPSCPNKPFENWIQAAREFNSIVHTDPARAKTPAKKIISAQTPINEIALTTDSALVGMENHLKKPK
jgi:hypothetical protein